MNNDPNTPREVAGAGSSLSTCSPASFDEVWDRLRPFMPDDFSTHQAIIVMDAFGWIDNGPCTCGLEIYGDPCPHHSVEAKESRRRVLENVERVHHYQRGRTSITGLRFWLRENAAGERLVVVVMSRLVLHSYSRFAKSAHRIQTLHHGSRTENASSHPRMILLIASRWESHLAGDLQKPHKTLPKLEQFD